MNDNIINCSDVVRTSNVNLSCKSWQAYQTNGMGKLGILLVADRDLWLLSTKHQLWIFFINLKKNHNQCKALSNSAWWWGKSKLCSNQFSMHLFLILSPPAGLIQCGEYLIYWLCIHVIFYKLPALQSFRWDFWFWTYNLDYGWMA
jgi:hypothetical protein